MSKFGDAFNKARKSGKKTFKFNGKSYTTKTKEEAAPPKPAKRSMKDKVKVPTGPQPVKLKGKASDARAAVEKREGKKGSDWKGTIKNTFTRGKYTKKKSK